MTDLADRLAQGSLWGRDDTLAKERKFKRLMAPKLVLPAIPEGPCCARCQHWRGGDGEDFGACSQIAVITDRIVGEVDKGQIAHIEEVIRNGWASEPLSIRGFFAGCTTFVRGEMR